MKHVHVLIFLLVAAAAGSAFGQTKVGTTGANFLQLPFSLRSAAMGDIGAVFVDRQAYASNPGSIGLLAARPEISLGPLVWSDFPSPADYFGVGAALSVISANIPAGRTTTLGIAAYSTRLTSDTEYESAYYQIPIGREFWWRDYGYHMLVGLGINRRVQLGLGAGLTYVRESVPDYSANAWATDFGVIARLPIALKKECPNDHLWATVTPSAGIAFTNVGPDMEFLTNDYPLPRTLAAGIGTEFVYGTSALYHGWELLSAAIGMEVAKSRDQDALTKVGGEIALLEAFTVRGGYLDTRDGIKTYGFALGSAGLVKSLPLLVGGATGGEPKTGDFLTARLNIDYTLSRIQIPGTDHYETYHGFTLTYYYGSL